MEETAWTHWLDLLCSSGSQGRSCICVGHIGLRLQKSKTHPFISTVTPGMVTTDFMTTFTHIKSVLKENHIDFFLIKDNIIATVLGLTPVILKTTLFIAFSTFTPFVKSSNVIQSWFICFGAPMRINGLNCWVCSKRAWAWPAETTSELKEWDSRHFSLQSHRIKKKMSTPSKRGTNLKIVFNYLKRQLSKLRWS